MIAVFLLKSVDLDLRSFCSVPFPYMVLLASGGHCILSIVEDVDKFYRLGETKDIAPGQTFDKVGEALFS